MVAAECLVLLMVFPLHNLVIYSNLMALGEGGKGLEMVKVDFRVLMS